MKSHASAPVKRRATPGILHNPTFPPLPRATTKIFLTISPHVRSSVWHLRRNLLFYLSTYVSLPPLHCRNKPLISLLRNLSGHLSLTFFLFRGRTERCPIPLCAEQSQAFFERIWAHGPLCELCVQRARSRAVVVLFSTTAAAPRIYPSTADKLLPGSRFDMRQVFATSPVVVFKLSRRGEGGEGGNMLLTAYYRALLYSRLTVTLLSAWNTAMHESNATCAVQQRSHPMIKPSRRSERMMPWWKSSIFFFWRSRIFQNKPWTSLWDGAIARRWCKYGLGGCFWFSVIWSVCVVRAVCVHAGREITFAWEEEEQARKYWYEVSITVWLVSISISLKTLLTPTGHNIPGPFLFWDHISAFSATPFAHTTLAFSHNLPTCPNPNVWRTNLGRLAHLPRFRLEIRCQVSSEIPGSTDTGSSTGWSGVGSPPSTEEMENSNLNAALPPMICGHDQENSAVWSPYCVTSMVTIQRSSLGSTIQRVYWGHQTKRTIPSSDRVFYVSYKET